MDAAELMRQRWRGQRGRLEVWYTTVTDPATGTGLWLHHELVAPQRGAAAYGHGWAAVFPPGAPPRLARFGPLPWPATPRRRADEDIFAVDGVTLTPNRLAGKAGELAWDLVARTGGSPLYTFPRWAWRRELLPAAQIVPMPTAAFAGTVHIGDAGLVLTDAPGATGRIYGHGNARRWGWLHADLGGGDVLEVVAAVSTRPGLRLLPPLPMVRLRLRGVEWPPGDPLLAAFGFHARLGLPEWTVRGRSGDMRLRVSVTLPPERTVAVDYVDPDGEPATCHNSEAASATIVLERIEGRHWLLERRWELDATAHAEVGSRP
ncbi:MAG TPA: hypothetical protein VFE14_08040 [Micromonosporaceae bacterium]|nr:hypothetical protein [Micromonosporaceae bacterium]